MGFYKREHGDWSRNSFRMNTVFILVFVILASSHASPAPDPDTHIHVHLDAADSKGGKSPKTGGGVLASNSSGDYGHWPPKPPHCGCGVCPCPPPPIKCHSHCMPHCLPTCKPPTCGCSTCPCPRPKWNRRLDTNTKAADYSGDAGDYGHWRPKICHSYCMPHCHPTCRPPAAAQRAHAQAIHGTEGKRLEAMVKTISSLETGLQNPLAVAPPAPALPPSGMAESNYREWSHVTQLESCFIIYKKSRGHHT